MNIDNNIFIRRTKKFFVESGNGNQSDETVATFVANLESLGFILSSDLISVLRSLDDNQMSDVYFEMIGILKELTGAKKKFTPMYANFPKSVMEMDEATLIFNAIKYYDSLEIPSEEKIEREPLENYSNNLTVIKLGTSEQYFKMFKNLIGSGTSISEADKDEIVQTIVSNKEHLSEIIPEKIPFKENLTFVSGLFYRLELDVSELVKRYNTCTDALRFAVSLNDGDVSLAENTKFKKMKRSTRRFILSLIEGQNNLEEDMLRHRMKWIRLGEILHPGEFSTKYPKSFKAFKAIRNSEKIETFGRTVELGLKEKNVTKILKPLMSRPGEFARRLDHILRTSESEDVDSVISSFEKIVGKISIPVLLQLKNHFENRNNMICRSVFPKGNVAKVKTIPFATELDASICVSIVSICSDTLIKRFSTKERLGNVFVSDDLQKMIVPFSQRSASKALKTIVRGSRLPLGDGDFVRFFIWWKNTDRRIDVDSSCVFFDRNYQRMDYVAFNKTSVNGNYAHHSGDIVDAPNGASEFIDLDIEKCVSKGIRYAVLDIRNFTGVKYSEMSECFSGFMMRKGMMTGEVFEPKTLSNKFDLNSDSISAMPVIIDVLNREMIWADVSLNQSIMTSNSNITEMVMGICEMRKPTLYDLFTHHGIARGNIVEDKDKADIVFSMDGDVTPFDIEKIMGEYLVD